ncbi:helix-turn-helix domain-containing protein [Pirellulaceae bacterium SH449]
MIMSIKGNNEEYFTTREAASYLGVAEDTVRTYCKRSLLSPARKLGNSLLFTRSECDRYQKERRSPGKPKKNS